MSTERDSLLPRLPSTSDNKNFYFMKKTKSQSSDREVQERAPSIRKVELTARPKAYNYLNGNGSEANEVSPLPDPPKSSWWSTMFSGATSGYNRVDTLNGAKPRKVPVKVEPKVYFANERTFLAWLHMAVTLATISMAIVAFAEANEWSQVYGLLLLPVAIAFCAYALYMYTKRAAMIRRKDPGPYEDRTGPIVLAILLGSAITVNFVVKLYSYTR